MANKPSVPPDRNAYATARVIKQGCTHQLACRCDVPYWLRESTAAEQRIEQRLSLSTKESK